jgi:hypothetical protein
MDCVCWYDIPTKTAITGDSLQGNGTPTQGVGFYQSLDAYESSVKKLYAYDIKTSYSDMSTMDSGISFSARIKLSAPLTPVLNTPKNMRNLSHHMFRKEWRITRRSQHD